MLKNILNILLLVFFISCGRKEEKTANDVYYTCSMDPQVVESKRGNCPICKMPLTEVKKGQMQNKDELQLSDQQIQLGNITTDSLREHLLGEDILLTGTIRPNQNTLASISSRVMGRIEKLYFKTTGDIISKGQPLYEIYSEDLNLIIKEMLLAAEKKKSLKNNNVDYDKIFQSTRNKLLLYGLTEEQITKIESENIQPYTIKILSKIDGIIYSVDTKEGNYLMEGGDVFHLADFSTVWVEAQVYSDYMNEIKAGMEAKVMFAAFPGKEFSSQLSFVNPELNPSSKINIIRVEIPNSNGDIKPGMQAYVSLLLKQKSALSLPTDAVIKDSKGSTVWLQTANNKFKSVMVQTGLEANGYTEILHGLNKGDVVIVSGAYLLNSEYIFKKGTDPMAGHEGMNM
ncbi:MAG: efflux RND transporter periplasmic adaptor subunit [Bacteroidota bacterium]